MKEELQNKIVEILSSIQSAAGKTTDFAIEQLPDIAQQYVEYGRITYTFFSLLIGILIVFCIYGIYKANENFEDEMCGFINVFGGLVTVVIFLIWCSIIQSTFFVWLAPKVWLLKELATLIKG